MPPVTGPSSVEGTFLWAVGLVGTVENGAIFITILVSKRCRRPLHFLIGCLALTDLLISVVFIPAYTYFLLEGTLGVSKNISAIKDESRWNVCAIGRSVFIEITSGTLTIKVLIAGYLYVYTKSRITAEKLFTVHYTLLYVFGAFLINFVVLFLPYVIGFKPVDFYPNANLCHKNLILVSSFHVPSFIYALATLSIHVLQLLFMCFCFIRVHYAIREGQSIWEKQTQDQPEDRAKDTIYSRAMKTTILLLASFCVCWLPLYIVNVIDPLRVLLPSFVHHVSMDLLLLKSAINPAVYIYGVRSVRRELRLLCMCRCQDLKARHLYFKKAPNSSSFDSARPGASDASTETC